MIVHFRWNKMLLFLTLLLQFTAVTKGQFLFITFREGDEVTVPCENLIADQNKCDRTNWLFSPALNTQADVLVRRGQIIENAKAKSDRLSVTANCSLVIKKVTVEDAGPYTCRQVDRSGRQQGRDSVVILSVVSMTEHKDADMVTLRCSVSIYDVCRYKVKWLYNGGDWDINTRNTQTSYSTCSATALLLTPHYIYESNYKYLQCEVTNGNNRKVQLYNFSPQLSSKKLGEAATTTREPETTAAEKGPDGKGKAPTTTSPTKITNDRKIESRRNTHTDTPRPDTHDGSTQFKDMWWLFILVPVALVALLIIFVVLIRWKRAKGKKAQMDDNIGLDSNPAVTQPAPETSQDTVDPEDGISYASISYTEKTNSKARVPRKDEGDAVTYSTVKASFSSSAGASTDPNNLYATVN